MKTSFDFCPVDIRCDEGEVEHLVQRLEGFDFQPISDSALRTAD